MLTGGSRGVLFQDGGMAAGVRRGSGLPCDPVGGRT